LARAISLFLGVIVMIVGSVFPFVLAKHATGVNQSIFLTVLVGMTGALIHGTGFIPRPRILQWFASPAFAWPVTIASLGAMAYLR
jgi:predicted membrane protein